MFAFRDTCDLDPGHRVEVAFTDATSDFQSGSPRFAASLAAVVAETGVPFARISQVHGGDVVVVEDDPPREPSDDVPIADALVTARRGVGLMVRVADCVPVLLAAPRTGHLGAVHAGRAGVVAGIVGRAVAQLRALGAEDVRAWVGPHVCGGCYEVPEQMREEVAALAPATHCRTRWGTPALDLGAGVLAQLEAAGVPAEAVDACTMEDERFHSHRRDGAAAGRIAGLVWQR